jgi:hypothetical protein
MHPHVIAYKCDHIREVLAESDRVDTLVEEAEDPDELPIPQEEYDRLCLQQRGLWALIRHLVFELAGTTEYDPPICLDIGDVIITVHARFDGVSGDNARCCSAGFVASRRVVRPEIEEESDDDDDIHFTVGDN